MELRDYLRIIRKHLATALVSFILVITGTWAYTEQQPRLYEATSEVYVVLSGVSTDLGSAQSGFSFVESRLASYALLVMRPAVLEPTSAALGYTVSASQVTASVEPGTQLILITANDTDPVHAADIANGIASQLGAVIDDFETPLAGIGQRITTRTVQTAAVPTTPFSPRPLVNFAIGFLLACALSLVLVLLMENLDRTVSTREHIRAITGADPIGIISRDAKAKQAPLVALNRKSARSEGFRTIRTNLQFVDVDNPPHILVVTSSVPREGKTTSSVNLAITIAGAGQKVLLIEADLRRPRAADYLDIDGSVGMTNVLSGQIPLEQAITTWHRGLISVLPSGPIPPNPSELLASDAMTKLLADVRALFDVVVIDSPPLLPVSDAAIIAGKADGAIFITRWGKTRRDQLEASLVQLSVVGARLLGTVVNFAPTGRKGYTYGYGYHYGYRNYGYGYGYAGGYGYSDKENTRGRLEVEDASID